MKILNNFLDLLTSILVTLLLILLSDIFYFRLLFENSSKESQNEIEPVDQAISPRFVLNYSEYTNITSFVIDSKSNRLFTAHRDFNVRCWSHQRLQFQVNLFNPDLYARIDQLVVRDNLVIASSGRLVMIWNLTSSDLIKISSLTGLIRSLVVTESGTIVAGTLYGEVSAFYLNGRLKGVMQPKTTSHMINPISLAVCKRDLVVVSSTSFNLKLWNVTSMEIVREIARESSMAYYIDIDPSRCLLFSLHRNSKLLNKIRVWNVTTGVELRGYKSVHSQLSIASPFRFVKNNLISYWMDIKFRIWDTRSGLLTRVLVEADRPYQFKKWTVAENGMIAYVTENNLIKIFDGIV